MILFKIWHNVESWMKQIYIIKYIFITPMTWPHPHVFIAPFVTARLWKTVSVLAKHNIYRRQSSFIWSQKVWNNRSELRSKKMENTSSIQLRAFSPICTLSLVAIKGRRMLNGPLHMSAEAWLARVQGKSAVQSNTSTYPCLPSFPQMSPGPWTTVWWHHSPIQSLYPCLHHSLV